MSLRRRIEVKEDSAMKRIFVMGLSAAAIAVAALGLVPEILGHYGIEVPATANALFEYIDVAGEILLGLIALVLILRMGGREK